MDVGGIDIFQCLCTDLLGLSKRSYASSIAAHTLYGTSSPDAALVAPEAIPLELYALEPSRNPRWSPWSQCERSRVRRLDNALAGVHGPRKREIVSEL